MTLFERLVWIGSLAAPLSGWAALLLLAALIVFPQLRGTLSGQSAAWILSLLVLAWLGGHLAVRIHGTRARRFTRDEQAELRFRLNRGRGFSHWRQLMLRRGHGWYSGRSHSGERPRYD